MQQLPLFIVEKTIDVLAWIKHERREKTSPSQIGFLVLVNIFFPSVSTSNVIIDRKILDQAEFLLGDRRALVN